MGYNKSNEIVGTRGKEDKEYHHDVGNANEVNNRINAIDNDSSKSEESFLEDFRAYKNFFFAEVNVFKKLKSYTTDNVNKSNNLDRLIILLKECMAFLKKQINKKYEVIGSLLNQLSK